MKINLSVAMSWRKTLQERHDELVGLRNQNSTMETRYYGANADKERVIKPRYDVVALDNTITTVAREIRKLDEAIKATNMTLPATTATMRCLVNWFQQKNRFRRESTWKRCIRG